jgi:hypothetical protein
MHRVSLMCRPSSRRFNPKGPRMHPGLLAYMRTNPTRPNPDPPRSPTPPAGSLAPCGRSCPELVSPCMVHHASCIPHVPRARSDGPGRSQRHPVSRFAAHLAAAGADTHDETLLLGSSLGPPWVLLGLPGLLLARRRRALRDLPRDATRFRSPRRRLDTAPDTLPLPDNPSSGRCAIRTAPAQRETAWHV